MSSTVNWLPEMCIRDRSHTGPVEEALKYFEELLNEFEELA